MVKKNVKIVAPLKYLSNFWRTLEMPLINYEIKAGLSFSKIFFFICFNDSASKMIKNTFFYPKSSFRSQDI